MSIVIFKSGHSESSVLVGEANSAAILGELQALLSPESCLTLPLPAFEGGLYSRGLPGILFDFVGGWLRRTKQEECSS